MLWVVFLGSQGCTVRYCYNAINYLQNSHTPYLTHEDSPQTNNLPPKVWKAWGQIPTFVKILFIIYIECPLFSESPFPEILTLNVRGPSYLGLTRSISWLLMPWLLTSPGHQQPWYWLWRIGIFLSYLRKDFNYLRRTNVEKWHKM